MDNHNILTTNDCVFLVDVLTKYINQNKCDYFLNENKFNQIYDKLNIIANVSKFKDANTIYSIYDKDFNRIK